MATFVRLLRLLVILLVVLALAVAGSLYLVVQRTLPQTGGNVAVAGLKDRVEVIRDKWGVPHIYAQNLDDLFFAQGYVTAQDRLWQLEFNRRVAAGRLSEFGGKGTLEDDIYLRTIGLYRSAQVDVEAMMPKDRAVLEAYARGVNAFIETHRSSLPLEFAVLNTLGGAKISPQPWTAVDSLAWGKVMAMSLSSSMGYELLRERMAARLGGERAEQLSPGYPKEGPFIIKEKGTAAAGRDAACCVPQSAANSARRADALAALERQWNRVRYIALTGEVPDDAADLSFPLGAIGSNSWVIDGIKSATGKPLLCNDMHLGIQNPSIWYEVHLEAPGLRIMGLTFPGVPGIVAGHNERIAWGFTNSGVDVQDLFVEKFNPQNSRQYEFQGRWEDVKVVREEFRVKGQAQAEVREILFTRHGPIVTDVIEGTTERVAMRWTANDPGTLFKAVMALWTAKNWQDFRAALKDWDVPSQNVIYADVEGNIGYQLPGRVPIRAKGDGSQLVPGWTGEHEWRGWIPYDDLPRTYNPSNHFVATANNRMIDYSYTYHLSNAWAPPYRAQRIEDLLTAKAKLSTQDMRNIQADVYSIPDRELAQYVLSLSPEDDEERKALDFIRNWDYRLTTDSVAASIMETIMIYAMRHTFTDELGDLTGSYIGNGVPVLLRILSDASSPWFDDTGTTAKETRDDILRRSLRDTLADLKTRLGTDMKKWTWGRLHTARFAHQALGGIPPLNRIFNIGPVPLGGGGSSATVYAASYSFNRPYAAGTISSERSIYDMSDLDKSLMVNTVGQSGQPGSKHWGDQVIDWRDVKHHPMPFSRSAVEQHKEAVLIMTPK